MNPDQKIDAIFSTIKEMYDDFMNYKEPIVIPNPVQNKPKEKPHE